MQQEKDQLLQKIENLNEQIDTYKKQIEDLSKEKVEVIISTDSSSREISGDVYEELANELSNIDINKNEIADLK